MSSTDDAPVIRAVEATMEPLSSNDTSRKSLRIGPHWP